MPMRMIRVTVIVIVGLSIITACNGDENAGNTEGSTAEPAPICITARAGDSALHLTVPAGFTDGSGGALLDQFWARPPADGAGSPDVVALDAYEREAPDAHVVQRAMSSATVPPDSGQPGYDEAVKRVRRERLTEVTWTAAERNGRGQHTGFVKLVNVDDTRFTVTVVASQDAFPGLRDQVLSTVDPGDCPSPPSQ